MTSSRIRVGLIGVGLSTKVFHGPFILHLSDQFILSAVVERKATSTQSIARDLFGSSIRVFNSVEELVASGEIDLLIVNSPNSTHFPYAKLALENGIHVAIEKPLCPTSKECFELAALAREKKLVLAPFQNRRFDSDFLTLKKLIDSNSFGDITEFVTSFDRYRTALKGNGNWKEEITPGNGVLYDLGSHLIDQILQLFGRPNVITAIKENIRSLGPKELEDTFIVIFRYSPSENRKLPLIVTAKTTMNSPVIQQLRYEVKGNKGSFIKRGIDPQEDQLKANPKALETKEYGVEDESIKGEYTWVNDDGTLQSKKITSEVGDYRHWFKSVAEAIRGTGELAVKAEEAADVVRMIELVNQSAEINQSIFL